MSRLLKLLPAAALLGLAQVAHAAGPDLGQVEKQPLNVIAIAMFLAFVGLTLLITFWAARRTKSAADFYAAGGGITGLQNGLAIAGDYMSAASFLGIAALVYSNGYDGLIYSIGFLVGWPIVMFLMAERLRNLGKFTFADVVSYRMGQTQMRVLSASGTLVVVAFYLITQMVGAGQLIKLLFGLDYWQAIVIVGVLMICYVTFGGMLATTWVQIIKAVMLLGGASFMAFMVLRFYNFDVTAMFARAVEVHPKHMAIMSPGSVRGRAPVSHHFARARADVRHRGAAAYPDALLHRGERRRRRARASVLYANDFRRVFLHPDVHHRFRRDHPGAAPTWTSQPPCRRQHVHRGGLAEGGAATCRPSGSPMRSAGTSCSASSRPWRSRRSSRWCRA